jgi:uncharacterized protein (TIGR02996 family)
MAVNLLTSLIANPTDKGLRLAYSDWLEETGADPHRVYLHRMLAYCPDFPDWNDCKAGETLRDAFFDQNPKGKKKGEFILGCYRTMDFRPGVKRLPNHIEREWEEPWYDVDGRLREGFWNETTWKRARLDDFEMGWFWDGDGTLAFSWPNGDWLINTDCKKVYHWKWTDKCPWEGEE